MWLFIILFFIMTGFSVIFLLGVWSNIRSSSSEITNIWTQLKEVCYKRSEQTPNVVNSCKMFLLTKPVVVENLLASSKKLEEAVQCNDRVNVELSENLFRKSLLELNGSVKKIPKLKACKSYHQSVKVMDELGGGYH